MPCRRPSCPPAWRRPRAFRLFHHDLRGRLVLAQALERTLAYIAVSRPGTELDFGDQLGLHPDDALLSAPRHRNRARTSVFSASSFLCRSAMTRPEKPVPTWPTGASSAVLVIGQHQRADAAAGLVRRQIAGDHEFLAKRAFRLHPIVAAAAAVRRVGALGDNAFEAHAAGVLQHHLAGLGEMLAEPQRPLLVEAMHQVAQLLLAVDQRFGPDVLAVEPQQIERIEDHPLALAFGERELQLGEGGNAILAENDDLAVEHRRLRVETGQRLRNVAAKTMRPVEAGAGVELDLTGGDMRLDAVAVELHLMQPFVSGRRVLLEPRQARRDERRQLRLAGTGLARALCLCTALPVPVSRRRRRSWPCGSISIGGHPDPCPPRRWSGRTSPIAARPRECRACGRHTRRPT